MNRTDCDVVSAAVAAPGAAHLTLLFPGFAALVVSFHFAQKNNSNNTVGRQNRAKFYKYAHPSFIPSCHMSLNNCCDCG
jgi:hypothetical protein